MMTDDAKIEARFWKALAAERVMMLGVDGVEDGFARPMYVQIDAERSPLWFFTSSDNHIVGKLTEGRRAIATFSAKGELYASIQGSLSLSQDRAMIDKLWNPQVAAWYEKGKDDPKLRLLRLDADQAEIWLDGSSLLAGVKSLLGVDPKMDYKDDQASVRL
ncbi:MULTISPECIES: pyridoxamine 5'-phosphate oxidase family protein [unclassified Paracoccus (in: a-proteobacteria)]|uniref:pyridoxamine 5'-phosphate oxidase family protein n=1 Tax=unclassified Paracoccus (in: a-proteobacteria) TaxID=2688777 RepID=UPI00190BF8CD|nr:MULTISPECIES: pyridoxamine 5'-phosphate oxidase family protein [unclassified Paracoccus (in: a-proteobacteria)]QQO44893.1 pyridoxamine 5'-phosphate oxidase family protein [Paracoccus sp. MC1862]